MNELRVADALGEVIGIANRANKYIDETMPWALAKDETKQDVLSTVMYNLAEAIRFIASLISPFMPETGEKIANQLGFSDLAFDSLTFGNLPDGTKINEATPLFVRIDAEKKIEELEAEFAVPEEKIEIEPFSENIEFEKFLKLDIRVGKVLECENVPKSNKLLRFTLEVGSETRQILSGIAKYYKPEDLIGKNLLFIANLPPRKMMGYDSCGMILSAEHDGKLVVTTVDGDIQSGAKIV